MYEQVKPTCELLKQYVDHNDNYKLFEFFYNFIKNCNGKVDVRESFIHTDKSLVIKLIYVPHDDNKNVVVEFYLLFTKDKPDVHPTIRITGDFCNTNSKDNDAYLFESKRQGILSSPVQKIIFDKQNLYDQLCTFFNLFQDFMAKYYPEYGRRTSYAVYQGDVVYLNVHFFPYFMLIKDQDCVNCGRNGTIELCKTYLPDQQYKDILYMKDIHSDPTLVCVKKIHRDQSMKCFERLNREIVNHYIMDHANIIKLYGITMNLEGDMCLVMEYGTNGSLHHYITNNVTDDKTFLKLMIDCIRGIVYLHHREVTHRDIKPDNIVVGEDKLAKIIDLGFSRLNVQEHQTLSNCGTHGFAAPEAYEGLFTQKSDVFSLGITLFYYFYLYYNKTIGKFTQGDDKKTFNSYTSIQVHPQFEANNSYHKPLYDILIQCIQQDPNRRCDIEQLYQTFVSFYESKYGSLA